MSEHNPWDVRCSRRCLGEPTHAEARCNVCAGWHACEHPERTPDDDVLWHLQPPCRGCPLAAEAWLRQAPAEFHVEDLIDTLLYGP